MAMDLESTVSPAVAAAKALLLPGAALNRHAPKRQLETTTPDHADQQRRYGFRSGGLGFLTAPQVGCEALTMPDISHIPNSPAWLRGVMNLRGALVPVFDLALSLGLDEQARGQEAILVFDKGPLAAAIVTDGHPRRLAGLVPMKQMPELPVRLAGGVIKAGHTAEEEVWLEFDHTHFFQSLKNGASHRVS